MRVDILNDLIDELSALRDVAMEGWGDHLAEVDDEDLDDEPAPRPEFRTLTGIKINIEEGAIQIDLPNWFESMDTLMKADVTRDLKFYFDDLYDEALGEYQAEVETIVDEVKAKHRGSATVIPLHTRRPNPIASKVPNEDREESDLHWYEIDWTGDVRVWGRDTISAATPEAALAAFKAKYRRNPFSVAEFVSLDLVEGAQVVNIVDLSRAGDAEDGGEIPIEEDTNLPLWDAYGSREEPIMIDLDQVPSLTITPTAKRKIARYIGLHRRETRPSAAPIK